MSYGTDNIEKISKSSMRLPREDAKRNKFSKKERVRNNRRRKNASKEAYISPKDNDRE